MSYFTSPEFCRVILLGGIVALHVKWRELINSVVPEPYLDEVFHIPQAQAYWQGKWSQWDPKITTPAGLYYITHALSKARQWINPEFEQTTEELRFVNIMLLYFLLVALYIWTAVSKRQVNYESVLQREFSIILFPLLFFFSGLYYTDLFSALTVVLTYTFWSAANQSNGAVQVTYQLLQLVCGVLSLLTRQTNIFWVAIFLGGLQIVKTVKQFYPKQIHDSPISDAFFEEFPITSISIAQHINTEDILLQLFFELWPQISLLAAFTGFVIGNGGVVLGDKSNHVATVHLPQMLYLWPAIVFLSWPVLLPFIVDIFTNKVNKLPLRSRFPRTATIICFLIVGTAVVRCNTIVHPFTLADNRHYTFYVFRLLRDPRIKYAAVPVYFACGWLCISALGTQPRNSKAQDEDVVHVSFVLVFLISTTLSLVTATLVEPRYFIIPWLMWRLHLPEVKQDSSPSPGKATSDGKDQNASKIGTAAALRTIVQYSTWLELLWYISINVITGYMFLYRGFSWLQEPGKVQRFMW